MRETVEAAHHLRARTRRSMVHSGDFLLHVLNLVEQPLQDLAVD